MPKPKNMSTPAIAAATAVAWNELAEVGMPSAELRSVGPNDLPRTFLCRGEYSIFTSTVYSDGSGFASEDDDPVKAWAMIQGH